MTSSTYEVVPEGAYTPPERTDWSPVKEVLLTGKMVFFRDEALTHGNVKYLTLAFKRMVPPRSLHARKDTRNGAKGRILWLEPQ